MKKNKPDLNVNEKLVKMFEDQIPEDRQQVLRDIDSIMCNMFELQPNDLPWINPNKHDKKKISQSAEVDLRIFLNVLDVFI